MTPWDTSTDAESFPSPSFSPALASAQGISADPEPDSESVLDDSNRDSALRDREPEPVEVPLEYRKLWEAAQPRDGAIKPACLASLLQRAQISAGASARILSDAGARADRITEPAFYRAIGQAAAVQGGETTGFELHIASVDAATEQSTRIVTYGQLNLAPTPALNFTSKTSNGLGRSAGDASSGGAGSSSGTRQTDAPQTHFDTDSNNLRVMAREKMEGSFMFRHVVYVIDGSFNGVGVRILRRYRDFVWLLDKLLARYPFRMLPALPPKKVGMSGRFLTGDREFTRHRQYGLMRFANMLANHPVVGHDELTVAFFTSQSQGDTLQVRYSGTGAGLRESGSSATSMTGGTVRDGISSGIAGTGKSASSGTELEYLRLDPLFVAQFDEGEYENKVESFKQATNALLHEVIRVGGVLERDLKRRAASAADSLLLAEAAEEMLKQVPCAYGDTSTETHSVVDALRGTVQFGQDKADVLQLASEALRESPLEEIKRYRDMLRAGQEMFVRLAQLGGNSIVKIEHRIEGLRAQIADAEKKGNAREEDIVKLHEKIRRCQSSMQDQVTRDWLIKRVVGDEIDRAQGFLSQLSLVLQRFAHETAKGEDLLAEVVTRFDKHVECLRH